MYISSYFYILYPFNPFTFPYLLHCFQFAETMNISHLNLHFYNKRSNVFINMWFAIRRLKNKYILYGKGFLV